MTRHQVSCILKDYSYFIKLSYSGVGIVISPEPTIIMQHIRHIEEQLAHVRLQQESQRQENLNEVRRSTDTPRDPSLYRGESLRKPVSAPPPLLMMKYPFLGRQIRRSLSPSTSPLIQLVAQLLSSFCEHHPIY